VGILCGWRGCGLKVQVGDVGLLGLMGMGGGGGGMRRV
jgi:hypothetical protein